MHDNFGDHAEKEVLENVDGEPEVRPVVAVLHDLETVAVKVDITVKIQLVESLHRDFDLAMVLGLVAGLLEGEVVLDRAAGMPCFLVLARADG